LVTPEAITHSTGVVGSRPLRLTPHHYRLEPIAAKKRHQVTSSAANGALSSEHSIPNPQALKGKSDDMPFITATGLTTDGISSDMATGFVSSWRSRRCVVQLKAGMSTGGTLNPFDDGAVSVAVVPAPRLEVHRLVPDNYGRRLLPQGSAHGL
jgi:hypothetical protein